jgi:symplekin
MDMDDEDLLVRWSDRSQTWRLADDQLADTLPEEEEDEAITVTEFQLPAPGPLEPAEKEELVTGALSRICLSGDELAGLPNIDVKDGVALAVQPKEAWMLLMARLATRGAGKRKAVSDYINADFSNRCVCPCTTLLTC